MRIGFVTDTNPIIVMIQSQRVSPTSTIHVRRILKDAAASRSGPVGGIKILVEPDQQRNLAYMCSCQI